MSGTLRSNTYHIVSTIGAACTLGSVDPGSMNTNELLRYDIVADTGCKIVDIPILTYTSGMCVLYEDLEANDDPYYEEEEE